MHPQLVTGAQDAHVLIVADHASNAVPTGISLGIDEYLLDLHIAVDIGTAALARGLARALDAPAVLAGVSRLVIDLNREPEAAGLIPAVSDGHIIPGNSVLPPAERERRVAAFHSPYHQAISALLDERPIELVVAVHSFTPQLATRLQEARPWQVGLLHNRDDRAARVAIAHLRGLGLIVGDNEPYSGVQLNYTMNRHAEARGLPYLGFEVRQDLLVDNTAVDDWRKILSETIGEVLSSLRAA
jgi:predicted N-formylglutamate amidohydrolase